LRSIPLVDIKPKEGVVDIFRDSIFFKKDDSHFIIGTSLFIFAPENKFRRICYYISESRFCTVIVFLLIVLQTVTLAIENPLGNPDSDVN
jgi:hypothetical protein